MISFSQECALLLIEVISVTTHIIVMSVVREQIHGGFILASAN